MIQDYHRTGELQPGATKREEHVIVTPKPTAPLPTERGRPILVPPHFLMGSVTSGGAAVPDGTMISPFVGEAKSPQETTVVSNGQYKLLVNVPEFRGDKPIEFTIDGIPAMETIDWEQGGADVLNLTTQPTKGPAPHLFLGRVTIDGTDAPDGALVRAIAGDTDVAFYLVRNGTYVLIVPEDNLPDRNSSIRFTVVGIPVAGEIRWISGGADELNLEVTMK